MHHDIRVRMQSTGVLCPERHHEQAQWRIIQMVIASIRLSFDLVIECEVAGEQRLPRIKPISRHLPACKRFAFLDHPIAPVETVIDVVLEADLFGFSPRPPTQLKARGRDDNYNHAANEAAPYDRALRGFGTEAQHCSPKRRNT